MTGLMPMILIMDGIPVCVVEENYEKVMLISTTLFRKTAVQVITSIICSVCVNTAIAQNRMILD